MEIHSKNEYKKFIIGEVESIYRWICPNCCESFESEEDQTKVEFVNDLYKNQKIRRVNNGAMIGCFCKECYTDPEFEGCTL